MKEPRDELLRAAESGDVNAQERIGKFYSDCDYEKAIYWLSLAIEQGSSNAKRWLGELYILGHGVTKDDSIGWEFIHESCGIPCDHSIDKKRTLISKIQDLAVKHRITLACEKKRLIYKDAYGCARFDKWYKDGIDYFINVVATHEIRFDADDIECYRDEIVELIDTISQEAINEIDTAYHEIVYDDSMTGIEYENFCKQLLERHGWSIQITKATGDQGVDLIASQGSLRVAIQCKKSASAIGNKAVQEVVSGAKHYSINHAVVVSNSVFTPQARALATTNHIHLIHHFELSELYNRLSY